jgi:hypothetical protein
VGVSGVGALGLVGDVGFGDCFLMAFEGVIVSVRGLLT